MKTVHPRAFLLAGMILAWSFVACAPTPGPQPPPTSAVPATAPAATMPPVTPSPSPTLPPAAVITGLLPKPTDTVVAVALARFPFSASNLQNLQPILRSYNLAPGSVSYAKTVGWALPDAINTTNPIVLMNSPLQIAPTLNTREFTTKSTAIGTLATGRTLPLSQTPAGLRAGTYLVTIEKDQVYFVDSANTKVPASKVQIRTFANRTIRAPETIITVKDICWAWQTNDRGAVQICTEPSLRDALTRDQTYATLTKDMEAAVNALTQRNLLGKEEINWKNGTISDVEGALAEQKQRASFLAAPVVKDPGLTPRDGTLIGAVAVSLDMDLKNISGAVKVPPGAYAVRIYGAGTRRPYAQFVPADTRLKPIQVDADEVQRRGTLPGQTEEPLAIIYHWCFIRWCFPPD